MARYMKIINWLGTFINCLINVMILAIIVREGPISHLGRVRKDYTAMLYIIFKGYM